MNDLDGSVHLSPAAVGMTIATHTGRGFGQPTGRHSVSDARGIRHNVRNEVLLVDAGEQVRPRAQCKNANVVASVCLGPEGGAARVHIIFR